MEELLFIGFDHERHAYQTQIDNLKSVIAQKDALIQHQRQLWEADTLVSDSTSFLYETWKREHAGNPVLDQLIKEAAVAAHESPHMSRVNRIMCMLFGIEQKALNVFNQDLKAEVVRLKAELVAAAAIIKDKSAQLDRMTSLDKILEQNAFYQRELMEMGKKVIALEDFVNKAEEIVNQRVLDEVAKVNAVHVARKQTATDALNNLHVELMGTLCRMFDGKEPLNKADKVELQDVLVHHLDRVRLLLHLT